MHGQPGQRYDGALRISTWMQFRTWTIDQRLWKTSYPIRLREAGYVTAFAGKFGFEVRKGIENGPKYLPEGDFHKWGGGPGQTHYATAKNPSMKAYADEYPHSSRSYGAFGRDFIKESAKGKKPFCLSISFKAPHKPDQPDPLFDHLYTGKTFTKPANYGRQQESTFRGKANRVGSTNALSVGATVTNMIRSWQSIIKWSTEWTRPWG